MAPHSPHQREKSQRAQVESSVRAELDLENRNYVIIDKGRNVTIVKSQTENNPPRTVPNTEIKDEEVRVAKNMKTTDEAKPKRFKITKKVIEELISDYVLDAELMLKD